MITYGTRSDLVCALARRGAGLVSLIPAVKLDVDGERAVRRVAQQLHEVLEVEPGLARLDLRVVRVTPS